MKRSELEYLNEEGSVVLTEWVLRGVQSPEVKIYHDPKTGIGYQVYEDGNLYRRTETVSKGEDAFEYEKTWRKLD